MGAFVFILFLGCATASAAPNDTLESERTIQLSFSALSNADPQTTFDFLRHLDQWYLQLTSDHKKFVLLNSKELNVGTQIENEEASGGQHLKHLYTVTKFDPEAGIFQIVSPISRAVIWGIIRFQNKTILTIGVKRNEKGACLVTADLQLVFSSKSDKNKAIFFQADRIWQKHMNIEMTKAVSIVESLQHREYQSAQ